MSSQLFHRGSHIKTPGHGSHSRDHGRLCAYEGPHYPPAQHHPLLNFLVFISLDRLDDLMRLGRDKSSGRVQDAIRRVRASSQRRLKIPVIPRTHIIPLCCP